MHYWYGFITGSIATLTGRAALHGDWVAFAEGVVAVVVVQFIMMTTTRPPARS